MQIRRQAAVLSGLLVCLAAALVLYHSLAGGTLLTPNVYNSYALQAENWLAGHLDIQNGADYDWLELAVYNGRYYQSFPPVPAVFMLPWVLACGGASAVPGNLIALLAALACAAGCFLCCQRAGLCAQASACLTVFVGFGSNCFWLSCSGGVWFLAQLFGLCFAFWGLFFALGNRAAAASLCFALAVGCRPFYAALLAVWFLRYARGAKAPRRLLPALLPAVVVAAALMAYNFARFGNVLEFGHNYLPEFLRAEYGQFSFHYLLPNLLRLFRPVTLDPQLQLHFEVFNGFLFFVANPLFLLAFLRGGSVLVRREKASPALPLPAGGLFVFVVCVLLTLLLCMHRTLGGWQFGARYMVDLFPWVILWFLSRPQWKPGSGAYTLCGLSVLFNLYGAVYMLTL